MAKESSKKLVKLAGRVIRTGKCTKKEAQALAGSVLVQFEAEAVMTMAEAFGEWRRMAEARPDDFAEVMVGRSKRKADRVGAVDAELLTDLMRIGRGAWEPRLLFEIREPARRSRRAKKAPRRPRG